MKQYNLLITGIGKRLTYAIDLDAEREVCFHNMKKNFDSCWFRRGWDGKPMGEDALPFLDGSGDLVEGDIITLEAEKEKEIQNLPTMLCRIGKNHHTGFDHDVDTILNEVRKKSYTKRTLKFTPVPEPVARRM